MNTTTATVRPPRPHQPEPPPRERVPAALLALDRWLLWGWAWSERKAGWDKVPLDPRTGLPGDATSVANWMTYDDAVAAAGRRGCSLGFAVRDGDDLVGTDLDHCRDPATGAIEAWAMAIVRRLDSYAEITPSETGLRAWARGKLPPGRRKRRNVEMYEHGRYFTFTGWHLDGTPTEVNERPEAIAAVHAEYLADPPKPKPGPKPGPGPAAGGDLMAAMRRSRDEGLKRLLDGDTAGHGSHSEADLALCGRLMFWSGGNVVEADRLFRASGLFRPKWDEPRGDRTYGERTLGVALAGWDGECYSPAGRGPRARSSANGNGRHEEVGGGDPEGGDDEGDTPIPDRWPTMNAAAYHGIAGEVVRMIDPHTESDPVATLIQLLVGFGNLAGRNPHFVVGATRHYPALNIALVGPTAGGRKGSSWDCTRHVLQHLDEGWARDRIKGGLVSGEGLIFHVRDPATKRVAIKDKKTGKVEGYEDVEDDPGIADKRLLAVETELGRMLKAMNREANTLSDVVRQAWDCMPVLGTLAKNSPNRASDAHVSIVGHITQADIRRHLSDTDGANGFGNRFLWACVRRSKELPDGGDFYAINWTPVVVRLRGCLAAARGTGVVGRDRGAAKLWREVYGELSAGKPGLLGAILGRAEPQVMRLALIYALLDESASIQVEHLTAALAVWTYCEESCRLIFGDSLGDPESEKLLEALRAAPDGLARTEITARVFRGNKKSAEIAALLSRLLDLGLIHRITTPSSGKKPTERWYAGRGGYRATNLSPIATNFTN